MEKNNYLEKQIIANMRKDNPHFERLSIDALKNAISKTKTIITKYPEDSERLYMKEKIKLFEQIIKEKQETN